VFVVACRKQHAAEKLALFGIACLDARSARTAFQERVAIVDPQVPFLLLSSVAFDTMPLQDRRDVTLETRRARRRACRRGET
jgi:hypothetical protein